jgi:hypothetical protein
MVEKQNMPKKFRDFFWKHSNKPLFICKVLREKEKSENTCRVSQPDFTFSSKSRLAP